MQESLHSKVMSSLDKYAEKHPYHSSSELVTESVPPEDPKIDLMKSFNAVENLMPRFEEALVNNPDYAKSAAKAHFRGREEVVFGTEDEAFAVISEHSSIGLCIARLHAQPTLGMEVVELMRISNYYDDDIGSRSNIVYMGPQVFERFSGPEMYPKANTEAALNGAHSLLAKLESLNPIKG